MDTPAVDPVAIARLQRIGGVTLVRSMLEMYLGLAAERQRALSDALEAGDAPALERTAHTMKSSAGNVGATRLQRVASEVESLAARGTVDRELGARMVAECEASVAALRQVLEELEP